MNGFQHGGADSTGIGGLTPGAGLPARTSHVRVRTHSRVREEMSNEAVLMRWRCAGSWLIAGDAFANAPSPVSIEIVGADGQVFREFPVSARDGALRSYLQAEKGARYQVRVRNNSGQRLGLVIAVDGRNIINGGKSDLARTEPMYVLDACATQDYAGWRANLDAINEFYFTDWSDSYAEAFGDRSARGVIAVAVYRRSGAAPHRVAAVLRRMSAAPAPATRRPRARADKSARRERIAPARVMATAASITPCEVEFVAQSNADSRHFIKYEWRETLCRKHLLECGEQEPVLG